MTTTETTTTTTTTTAARTTEIKNNINRVILRTREQLTVLSRILREINFENIYFILQSIYFTGVFKIRRGDTNFGVRYEWPKRLATLSVSYN